MQKTEMLEALIKVYDLFEDPARWTRNARARDQHGGVVNVLCPTARAWCLIGALERFTCTDFATLGSAAHECWAYLGQLAGQEPVTLNDLHGHTAVRALLERGIHRLIKELAAVEPGVELVGA